MKNNKHYIKTSKIKIRKVIRCSGQNENRCLNRDNKCFQAAALIPARAGSKGIKNKNLSIIGNETLLSRAIKTIHQSGQFESVWVLTDGAEIAQEGIKHRAKIHWRDPLTATDNATTVSAVEDFLKKQTDSYDVIAVVQCTSPFLKRDFLRDALKKMLDTEADCIFSVTKTHHLRWIKNNGNFVTPLNFNPKKRPRRQDQEGEFVENGMFYFLKPELVLQHQILQNNRCTIFEIPKHFSIDIDDELDLLTARSMLQLLDNLN